MEEVVRRLDKIEAGQDRLIARMEARFDAMNDRFDKLYHLIFIFMSTMIAGFLGLLAKAIGLF